MKTDTPAQRIAADRAKLNEAVETDTLAASINFVLEYCKRTLDENFCHDIRDIVDMGLLSDLWYEWVEEGKVPEADHKVLKKYSAKKWDELFAAKFGMPSGKYSDSLNSSAMGSLSDLDKKVWTMIGEKLTTSYGPRDVRDLAFYVSGSKVFVFPPDNVGVPMAVFGLPSLEHLGMDQTTFVAWLKRAGIKQVKRPKTYRSPPSQYD